MRHQFHKAFLPIFLLVLIFIALPCSLAQNVPLKPAARPLGVNLEAICDYARSMVFVDLVKSGRPFGSPDSPWDQKAPVDENGWPTQDAGIVLVADTPLAPGDYLFSCTGHCTITTPASKASVKSQTYDRDSKTTSAIITVDQNAEALFLGFKNTNGGIKNIRVLRPGYLPRENATFSREFLKALAPFSVIRTMDFTHANGNPCKEWLDRTKPTTALQSTDKGAAWEYAIQLANETKKDLWINIPTLASDDYVKQLATLFKNTYPKDRILYIEYSNELWNFIFPQYNQNLDAAKADLATGKSNLEYDGNDHYLSQRRAAKRLLQITAIFAAVYADKPPQFPIPNYQLPANLRPVLASQIATPAIARNQLEFIQKNYGPPSKLLYGLAGAPYIALDSTISNRNDLTPDELFQKLLPPALQQSKKWITDYQALAKEFHLHHLAYEGGPHLEGEPSVQAKIAANRDPRMTQLLTDYFAAWYSSGGELFCYYNLCSPYSKFGSWGLTEDVRKGSVKWKALPVGVEKPGARSQ